MLTNDEAQFSCDLAPPPLRFSNLQRSDDGYYLCHVETAAGEVLRQNFKLTVQGQQEE